MHNVQTFSHASLKENENNNNVGFRYERDTSKCHTMSADMIFYFLLLFSTLFIQFTYSFHQLSIYMYLRQQPANPEIISAKINRKAREIFYSIRTTIVNGRHAALQMVFMNLLDSYLILFVDVISRHWQFILRIPLASKIQNIFGNGEKKWPGIDKNVLSKNSLCAFWQNSVVNLFLTIYSRLTKTERFCFCSSGL